MKSISGIALLASILTAASACVVATQPGDRRGPGPGPGPGDDPPSGELDPRLVGCWDWYNYRDSHTGNESYRGRLELDPDGGYAWRAYPWASSEGKGLPEFNDLGEWDTSGGILELFADRAPLIERTISFDGDTLYLDGVKQFVCL
jgi:hypothetical protein